MLWTRGLSEGRRRRPSSSGDVRVPTNGVRLRMEHPTRRHPCHRAKAAMQAGPQHTPLRPLSGPDEGLFMRWLLVFDDMRLENSPEASPTTAIELAMAAQTLDSR